MNEDEEIFNKVDNGTSGTMGSISEHDEVNDENNQMESPNSLKGPKGFRGTGRGRGFGTTVNPPQNGLNNQGPGGAMNVPRGPWGGPRHRGRGGFRGPPPGFRGPPPFGPRGPRFGPRGPPHFDPNWGPMPPGMNGPMGHPRMPPNMNSPRPWGGPMSMQDGSSNHNNQNFSLDGMDLSGEIWVETKSGDGKSYFYNARTRETTWTKPEGENVKILTQQQVEQMAQAAGVNQTDDSSTNNEDNSTGARKENGEIVKDDGSNMSSDNSGWQSGPNQWGNSGPMGPPPGHGMPPFGMGGPYGGPPPYGMHGPPMGYGSGPGPGWNGYGMPPGPPMAGNAGWGMPPPGMDNMSSGMGPPPPGMDNMGPPQSGMDMGPPPPGMENMSSSMGPPPPGMDGMSSSMGPPPPGMDGMSSGMGPPPPGIDNMSSSMGSMGDSNKHGGSSMKDGGNKVMSRLEDSMKKTLGAESQICPINPEIIASASEWSEHEAPDNRKYYYNSKTQESVWQKPQPMKDLEAAQLAFAQSFSIAKSMGPPGTEQEIEKTVEPVNDVKLQEKEERSQEKESPMEVDNEESQDAEPEEKPQTTDFSRPVSSQPVSGTPWCVVWTGDRRVFFYNPTTKTSVWEKPPEILDRPEVDKMISNPPPEVTVLKNKAEEPAKDEPMAKKIKADVAPVLTSPVTQPMCTTISLTMKDEVKKIDVGKEAAIEAEVKAARERAIVPLEIRMKQFRDLLAEKGVSAFSSWEKELSKIVFDPRYLLLTSKERKQVFEKYVKERAEEERREKRNKLKEKKEEFRRLLEESALNGKSSFTEFSSKHGKDDRFKNIEKMRERESLFDEFLLDVRRKEKEEKAAKRDQVRKEFFALLKEFEVDHHSRWSETKKKIDSDPRYKNVDSSAQREDWFRDYVAKMKEDRGRSRDRSRDRDYDRSRDRNRGGRNRDADRDRDRGRDGGRGRDGDRDRERGRDRGRDRERDRDQDRSDRDKKSRADSRDRSKDSEKSKERKEKKKDKKKDKEDKDSKKNKESKPDSEEQKNKEENDVVKENNAPVSDNEREEGETNEAAEEEQREKQRRIEESLRKREEEVQKTLAGHLRDRDKERQQHKHDEATHCFNALLADLVRSTDFTWKEAKKSLKKDSRWESASPLEREEKEKLFIHHIENLTKRKREKFRELLEEVVTTDLDCGWKEIKKILKEDPRYTKFSSSDKKCEKEFREYLKDRLVSAKADFRELLKETKTLTHKSLKLCTEGESHMREVLEILQKDKRYLILDSMADERSKILMGYLEELEQKGPPPPPTASEPTRRK